MVQYLYYNEQERTHDGVLPVYKYHIETGKYYSMKTKKEKDVTK
jgi:hypothetical protein